MKVFILLLAAGCLSLAQSSYFTENIISGIQGLFLNKQVEVFSKSTAGLHDGKSREDLGLVPHFNEVKVADHMDENLPKVRIGHRVVDLFNGWHFDDILMDSPDEIRPSAVIAFYDSSNEQCMKAYNEINFDSLAENQLPARSRLFVSRYDMYSAPRRAWYDFTPEMDLAKRFGVTSCPEVVFASRKCNGFTEWCDNGKDPEIPELDVLGCADFTEQCTDDLRSKWDGQGNLAKWIRNKVTEDGEPKISKVFGSYKEQGRWLRTREYTTCNTHFRNVYLSNAFPAFTKRGFKPMETPKEFQDWLLDFYYSNQNKRKSENWDSSATQMSFHEHPTTFIDLDLAYREKERMARKYLQPLLEEWTGIKPLELTSFYGLREYPEGSFLREHLDRIDTHVLSVTISVKKVNVTDESKSWPLTVTDWTGKRVAYEHPGGTMILYESSKLPHGRPTHNEGSVHVGCFCHFKPANMHTSEAKKWDGIAKRARDNMERHTERASFVATEEVEPSQPSYASINYGEGTNWRKEGEKRKSSLHAHKTVTFINKSDRTLHLHWSPGGKSGLSKPVFQASAMPGASFAINTYPGHQFYWSEVDSEKPIVGGTLTIDAGKGIYEYSLEK